MLARVLVVFFFYGSLMNFFYCEGLQASIIKDIEVVKIDKSQTIEEMKTSAEFKRTKLPFIRHSKDDYLLKITFDKTSIKDKSYILELEEQFNPAEVEEHIPYVRVSRNLTLTLNERTFIDEVYIRVINDEQRYVNFSASAYEESEYIKKELLLMKFYGVSYGIIFTAFLYYFALYLFNREEKSYIYYSLTQLSMLGMLFFISSKEGDSDRILMDFVFFFFFLFSNLFTKSFLNTKKNTPKLDKLLTYSLYFYVTDIVLGVFFNYHYLSDNIPMSLFLVLYIVVAYIVYNQGFKPALFYLIAWGIVVCSFLFVESQFYFTSQLIGKPIYIIHVITPLESLILAFALSYKMKRIEDEKEEQKHQMIQQSKMAAMGDMIANIAHQWRQPLTHLTYSLMNIKTAYKKDKLTPEYFDKKYEQCISQVDFMSNTIDDFRNFFQPDKKRGEFDVKEVCEEVLKLLDRSLEKNSIEVVITQKDKIILDGYKGEFSQVIFNIINNAKDEFIKKEISPAKIEIVLEKICKRSRISLRDNAGGVDEKEIASVFEPYFSTKEEGLGIGLYMSKLIIEKSMDGILDVKNIENGAEFFMEFDSSKCVKFCKK